jgi:uncharacterized membrane protein
MLQKDLDIVLIMIWRDIRFEDVKAMPVKKTDQLYYRIDVNLVQLFGVTLDLPLHQMTKYLWQCPIAFGGALQRS